MNITLEQFKKDLEAVGSSYEEWYAEAKRGYLRDKTHATAESASEAVLRYVNWADSNSGFRHWVGAYGELRALERRR